MIPKGMQVLKEVRERASDDPDVHILDLPPASQIEINAIERASACRVDRSR